MTSSTITSNTQPVGIMDFDILRAAVNLSKNEQIQRLPKLRDRLVELFPDREPDIKSTLLYWADNITKKA